ncbi:MAG TPA: hypothetical protein VH062_10250 [Polyangiaceae bacterium]|jgi:hypothetical protein|nr:hypothetical protein [Polyangiaceae bacterium]
MPETNLVPSPEIQAERDRCADLLGFAVGHGGTDAMLDAANRAMRSGDDIEAFTVTMRALGARV